MRKITMTLAAAIFVMLLCGFLALPASPAKGGEATGGSGRRAERAPAATASPARGLPQKETPAEGAGGSLSRSQGRRGAFYGRFRHAIPTHIRPQVRDLALRGLVALMVAVELTTLLRWRRADDDHQNEGGGINHGDLFSWPARPPVLVEGKEN
jgi:hypothetical protein